VQKVGTQVGTSPKRKTAVSCNTAVLLIGATGFEPATTCTPCK